MPDETQLEAVDEDDAKSVVFDSDDVAIASSIEPAVRAEPVVEKLAGPSVDESLIERLVAKHFRSFVAGLRGDKSNPESLATSFKVVGNAWILAYSNNFEDRDLELFPTKAIDQYVARVDAKLVPLPYLTVWHLGKTVRVGQADVVARHGHFVLSAGTWDDTPKGQTARKYYAKHDKETSLSQGFDYNKRTFDRKHYWDFNTIEISLLRRGAEANRYTNLQGVKEMPVTEEKKKYLKEVFGDLADDILADLDRKGKALEDLGVEYKDFGHLDASDDKEAVDADLEQGLKSLVVELVGNTAEAIEAATEAVKVAKAVRAENAELKTTIAALKQQLDDRPRSASTDSASEMTVDRMTALVKTAAQKDPLPANSFFGFAPEES